MTVRHTHRPWWPPYLAAFTLVLAATILAAAYVAAAGPILPLHHAQVTLSTGVCSNDSMWTATLAVSADVADGTAHISDAASPWTHGVPFTHTYSIGRDIETWPVAVYVTWPDGFTSDTFHLLGHRPATGCVPPSTTPPTTTCAEAIPPRDNCGGTVPPTTTPPTTASLCNPPPSTGPGTVVCEPSTAPTPPTSEPVTSAPAPTSPTGAGGARATTTVALFLPVTGMATYTVLWIGGAVFFLGCVCIAISRRQARRHELDDWGMR